MLKISKYVVDFNILDNNRSNVITLFFGTRTTTFGYIEAPLWDKIKTSDYRYLPEEMIRKLQLTKILVDEKENELDTIVNENVEYIEKSDTLYFAIQPTAACPLGCGYCGQLHKQKTLDISQQNFIVSRIRSKLIESKYKNLNIGWFGGEPLSGLKVIENLSYHLQNLSKELDINYGAKIVTNGVSLSPEIALRLVDKHKINFIEITLDGSKEYHDARRHTKKFYPTFDRIYNNILNICKMNIGNLKISIRCNVDSRNKDGVSPLIKQISQDKLQDKVSFYVAPIHSWGNDAHLLAAEKKEFSSWEIDWLVELKESGFNIGFLPRRKKEVCMALNPKSELIDPYGGVYGCTEVSLVPTYEIDGENIHKLGEISDKDLPNLDRRDNFLSFYKPHNLNKFHCPNCPMLPVCGGSCPKEWYEGRIPCPSTKFNIKEKMMLHYLNLREKSLINKEITGCSEIFYLN